MDLFFLQFTLFLRKSFIALFQLVGDLQQYTQQVGYRTAGSTDIGHKKHCVAGGFVDLNPELIHQVLIFKGIAIHTGSPDVKVDLGGVKHKFIAGPGFFHTNPARFGIVVLADAGAAILGGDQILYRKHVKILS